MLGIPVPVLLFRKSFQAENLGEHEAHLLGSFSEGSQLFIACCALSENFISCVLSSFLGLYGRKVTGNNFSVMAQSGKPSCVLLTCSHHSLSTSLISVIIKYFSLILYFFCSSPGICCFSKKLQFPLVLKDSI